MAEIFIRNIPDANLRVKIKLKHVKIVITDATRYAVGYTAIGNPSEFPSFSNFFLETAVAGGKHNTIWFTKAETAIRRPDNWPTTNRTLNNGHSRIYRFRIHRIHSLDSPALNHAPRYAKEWKFRHVLVINSILRSNCMINVFDAISENCTFVWFNGHLSDRRIYLTRHLERIFPLKSNF